MRLPIPTPHTSSWSPSPLEATSVSSQGAGRGQCGLDVTSSPERGGGGGLLVYLTRFLYFKKMPSRAFDSVPFPACRTASNQMAHELGLRSHGVCLTAASSARGRWQDLGYFVKSSSRGGEA